MRRSAALPWGAGDLPISETRDIARSACRGLAAALAVGVLGLAAPALAAAQQAGGDTLTTRHDSLRWSGNASTNVMYPDDSACATGACDTQTVRLDLPSDAWQAPGGMLVSLKWPDSDGPGDIGYDLDLYVYGPGGRLVGKSEMWNFSTAEGVWVQNPRNGPYRVEVVPKTVVGEIPYQVVVDFHDGYTLHESDQFYDGAPLQDYAGFAYHPELVVVGADRKPSRPLLPDLVPGKPQNFHMETTAAAGFYFTINHGTGHPPSCYPQETAGVDSDQPGGGPHPTRCLRFDQALKNEGTGPYELRVYDGEGDNAYQAIYRSDGGYALPKAGQAHFSSAHGHIHFVGFDKTGLYTIAADGSPGKLVAEQPDKGRCATDSANFRFGRRSAGPPRYYVPSTCDTNDHSDPHDPRFPGESYFRSGISAGYDDNYPWFIPDQYIDVSNVPDGRYLVVDRINMNRNVEESDTSNDVSEACVVLHGNTAHRCPLPGS